MSDFETEQYITRLESSLNQNDKRIAALEGAAAADTDRLKAAAKRAGIQYFGCDTPEHLADEIERLRGKNKELAGALNLAVERLAQAGAAPEGGKNE